MVFENRGACLRCKKRGEVCYWPLELKRPDGACHTVTQKTVSMSEKLDLLTN